MITVKETDYWGKMWTRAQKQPEIILGLRWVSREKNSHVGLGSMLEIITCQHSIGGEKMMTVILLKITNEIHKKNKK